MELQFTMTQRRDGDYYSSEKDVTLCGYTMRKLFDIPRNVETITGILSTEETLNSYGLTRTPHRSYQDAMEESIYIQYEGNRQHVAMSTGTRVFINEFLRDYCDNGECYGSVEFNE